MTDGDQNPAAPADQVPRPTWNGPVVRPPRRRQSGASFAVKVAVVVIVLGVAAVVLSRLSEPDPAARYRGRVVRVEGPAAVVGVLDDYRPGEYVVLRSVESGFTSPKRVPVTRETMLTIVADDPEAYLERRRADRVARRQARAPGQDRAPPEVYATPEPLDPVEEEDFAELSTQEGAVSEPGVAEESPARFSVDREREEALRGLDSRMAAVARRIRDLELARRDVAILCAAATTGTTTLYGPDGRPEGTAQIVNVRTPACERVLAEAEQIRVEIVAAIAAAIEQARWDGLYPGDVRETLATHGVDPDAYR